MILSADDQILLDSLKPEFVIAAFKHKGWRPMLKHRLPSRFRDTEATALIRGDSHAVVYTGDAWQTQKLKAVTAFAMTEEVPVPRAISFFAGFQETMENNRK